MADLYLNQIPINIALPEIINENQVELIIPRAEFIEDALVYNIIENATQKERVNNIIYYI